MNRPGAMKRLGAMLAAACVTLGAPAPAPRLSEARAAGPAQGGGTLATLKKIIDAASPAQEPPPNAHTADARWPDAPPTAVAMAKELSGAAPSLDAVDRARQALEHWEAWGRSAGRPSSVLFGVAEERRAWAAAHAARQVVALSAMIVPMIDGAVERADAAAANTRDAALEDRIDAALHARQVVLPLQAARATLVLSATARDRAGAGALALAAGEVARRVEPVSAWAQCERALISGTARVLEGKGDEALKDFDAAERAALAEDADGALRARVGVEAALGRALAVQLLRGAVSAREALEEACGRPPFLVDQKRDVGVGLLATDLFVRLARDEAARKAGAGERAQTLARAYERYGLILEGIDHTGRAAVYAHLARVMGEAADPGAMPRIARLARAALLVERGDGPGAWAWLEPVAADKASHEPGRSDVGRDDLARDARALAGTALALCGADRYEVAGTAWMDFASAFPDDPRAGAGLARAAGLIGALIDAALADSGRDSLAGGGGTSAKVRALRDRLLAMLETGTPAVAEADRARVALAWAPLEGELGDGSGLVEDARRAQALLERVRDPLATGDAARRRIMVWSDVVGRLGDAGRGERQEQAARVAARREAALALLSVAREPLQPWNGSLAQADVPAEVMRRASLGEGRALLALDRPGEAAEAVRELAEAGADEGGWREAALRITLEARLLMGDEGGARAAVAALGDGARSLVLRLRDLAWAEIEAASRTFVERKPARPQAARAPHVALVFRIASEMEGGAAQADDARRAWALLLAGDAPGAAAAFEAGLARASRLDLLRGLGEARLALGDDAAAFSAFRAVSEALEPRQDYTRDYWHAWTRMLEIMSRRPDAQERSASIRREGERLLALSSATEQPDCVARIKSVLAALGG